MNSDFDLKHNSNITPKSKNLKRSSKQRNSESNEHIMNRMKLSSTKKIKSDDKNDNDINDSTFDDMFSPFETAEKQQ